MQRRYLIVVQLQTVFPVSMSFPFSIKLIIYTNAIGGRPHDYTIPT